MGIAFWVGSGVAVFLVARIAPFLRRPQWLGELIVSLGAAAVAGLTATALDFGGWKELDGRSGLFALFTALAATGLFRFARRPAAEDAHAIAGTASPKPKT